MTGTDRFSVLVCCYGGDPINCSLETLQNVLAVERRQFDLHVGASGCAANILQELRRLSDEGCVDSLVETRSNIDRDPMMRLLIERTETEYFVWLDDTVRLAPGWEIELEDFLRQKRPFDLAAYGLKMMQRSGRYWRCLRARPWFVDSERFLSNVPTYFKTEAEAMDRAIFPDCSFLLARAEFLRKHNFPDHAMVRSLDDVLLGDLAVQQGGQMIPFSPALAARASLKRPPQVRRSEQREMLLNVDPVTGMGSGPTAAETKPQPALDNQDTSTAIASLNSKGNGLWREGKIEEAILSYKEALELGPAIPELHYNLGNCYRQLKDYRRAVDSLRRAVDLRPEYVDALNNLGIVLSALGRHNEALDTYRRALKVAVNQGPIYHNMAGILEAQGRLDEALSCCSKSLEGGRSDPRMKEALDRISAKKSAGAGGREEA